MTLEQMLPYILIGVVALLIVIWLVMRLNRKTNVVGRTEGDVLDEGAERAQRNQALIDAPKAVSQDVGITSANANSDKIAAAGAMADAEAGVSVAPTVGDPVPEPQPDPEPSPEPAPAPSGDADDLSQIKGLGPKLVTILAEQGVTRFDQIAAWTDDDVERIDATLGRFQGRITRDQWVEQAKLLAKGDRDGFSERFGQNT